MAVSSAFNTSLNTAIIFGSPFMMPLLNEIGSPASNAGIRLRAQYESWSRHYSIWRDFAREERGRLLLDEFFRCGDRFGLLDSVRGRGWLGYRLRGPVQ